MKKRLAIILSILAVAFCAIGVGLYFYFGSTKNVFTKAVTKSINEFLSSDSNMLKGINYNTLKMTTKTGIDVELDKDKYSASIDGDITYNKATNKVIGDLSILGGNKKIMDLSTVLDSSKLYVKINDLMKNYYYLDVPFDSSSTIEEKDITYVRELIQKGFFNNLEEKDFTKVDENIVLDKEFKVKKISLKLDYNRVNSILKEILKDIKKDKKAMSIMQVVSKDITEDSIDKCIKELDDENSKVDQKDYILYAIYISGKDNVLRHEISLNSSEDKSLNDYKLIINSYTNNSGFKTRELVLNMSDKEFAKISIVGTSKNVSTLTITSDVISGSGTITNSDTENSISLKLNMQSMDIGTINMSLTKVSDKEYSYKFNVDAGLLTYKVKVNSENKILLNENVTDIDVNNAKIISSMTKDEQNKIVSTIMTRIAKAFPKLIK